eukprot:352965-Chlamydomonas_euryale.AAC.25
MCVHAAAQTHGIASEGRKLCQETACADGAGAPAQPASMLLMHWAQESLRIVIPPRHVVRVGGGVPCSHVLPMRAVACSRTGRVPQWQVKGSPLKLSMPLIHTCPGACKELRFGPASRKFTCRCVRALRCTVSSAVGAVRAAHPLALCSAGLRACSTTRGACSTGVQGERWAHGLPISHARSVLQARDSGASSHTDTSVWLLPDASLNGIEFVVRLATTLNKKPSGCGIRRCVHALKGAAGVAFSGRRCSLWQEKQSPAPPDLSSFDAEACREKSTSDLRLGDNTVWSVSVYARSVSAKPSGEKPKAPVNPFLPYEEALWVAHLSDTHTCVLNKALARALLRLLQSVPVQFNVVEHHVIVVTRKYESQGDPLNMNDLAAAAVVLAAMPHGGMAFYNCGEHSGRSQPHKHMQIDQIVLPVGLQVVPLPLHDAAVGVDVECPPLLALASAAVKATGSCAGAVVPVKELPYMCYAAHAHNVPPEMLASTCDALLAAAFGQERDAGKLHGALSTAGRVCPVSSVGAASAV